MLEETPGPLSAAHVRESSPFAGCLPTPFPVFLLPRHFVFIEPHASVCYPPGLSHGPRGSGGTPRICASAAGPAALFSAANYTANPVFCQMCCPFSRVFLSPSLPPVSGDATVLSVISRYALHLHKQSVSDLRLSCIYNILSRPEPSVGLHCLPTAYLSPHSKKGLIIQLVFAKHLLRAGPRANRLTCVISCMQAAASGEGRQNPHCPGSSLARPLGSRVSALDSPWGTRWPLPVLGEVW